MSSKAIFGSCVIFTGVQLMTSLEEMEEYFVDSYYDYDGQDKWIMEDDEKTKAKLVAGLSSVGIKCEADNITIEWTDDTDGTKLCKCAFTSQQLPSDYYQSLLENGYLDIYIEKLSNLGPECCPRTLEFHLTM